MGTGDQFKNKAQQMADQAKEHMGGRKKSRDAEDREHDRDREREQEQEPMQGKMQDLQDEGERRMGEAKERFDR